jgi:hypothetical protein
LFRLGLAARVAVMTLICGNRWTLKGTGAVRGLSCSSRIRLIS